MQPNGLSIVGIYVRAFVDVLLARRSLKHRGLRDHLDEWTYTVAQPSRSFRNKASEQGKGTRAQAQGVAVNRAARMIPGHDSCLTRALALSRMLCRERTMHELIISTHREQDALAAHAWIRCQGRVLIGEGPMTEAPTLVVLTPEFRG